MACYLFLCKLNINTARKLLLRLVEYELRADLEERVAGFLAGLDGFFEGTFARHGSRYLTFLIEVGKVNMGAYFVHACSIAPKSINVLDTAL